MKCEVCWKIGKTSSLLVATAVGLVLGFVLRAASSVPRSRRHIDYVGYLGELYLQMLRAVSVPMTMTCLIYAFGSMEKRASRKIGTKFLAYVLISKIEAAILAFSLAFILIADKVNHGDNLHVLDPSTMVDTVLDIFRNAFPPNVVSMTYMRYETKIVRDNKTDNHYKWDVKVTIVQGLHMLGPMTVSVAVGMAANTAQENAWPLLNLVWIIREIMFKFMSWIMTFAPLGIVSLVASEILSYEDVRSALRLLWIYLAVTVTCYVIQVCAFYSLTYFLIVRKNPFTFLRQFSEAIATAFVTQSSLAALPISITCLQRIRDIDNGLIRLILPIACHVNKDGSNIHINVSVVYLAQMQRHHLTIEDCATIMLLSVPASITAAALPYGTIRGVVMIMHQLSMPIKHIGLVIGVEWILGRCQAAVNVAGDAIAVAILETFDKTVLVEARASSLMRRLESINMQE